MKRNLLFLAFAFCSCFVCAQPKENGRTPRREKRGFNECIVIDQANIRVLYALNAKDIKDENTYVDLGKLEIGKNVKKYSSEFLAISDKPEDSICEEPDVRPLYDAKDQMSFLLNFLNKNLHYPEEASKKGIDGTVNVQMVVEKDGTPTNFEIIREAHPLLDAEALRVAKLLPKFKPAMKDGKPVRCHFIFSVPFRCK